MKTKIWGNLIVVIMLTINLVGYIQGEQVSALAAPMEILPQSDRGDDFVPDEAREGRNPFKETGVNVEYIGHIGGGAGGVAVAGDYAYYGDGSSMVIMDISVPNAPIVVGRWLEFGISGIAVEGDYAYIASGEMGLRVIDVSNPTNPIEVGYYDTHGSATDVALFGDYAYVADGSFGLWVINVSNPTSPIDVGSYNTPGSAIGVALAGNYAYVADGYDGLRVIDVSDPTNPSEVGFYEQFDYVSGVAVAGSYVYLAGGGLRVIDVSNPASPNLVGSVSYWESSDVVVEGDYAYITNKEDGLQVIDVSIPTNPTEVGYYDTPGSAAQLAVAGGYAYVADVYFGFWMIDISIPSNPSEVGFYHAPHDAWSVAVAGSYAYVTDGWNGRLSVIDISDPAKPIGVGFTAIPKSGSVTAESYRVVVSGSYAYVAAWNNGLRVIDVSDPTNPFEIGFANTWGYPNDVAISGEFAYVADGPTGGLAVVDVSNPSSPSQVGWYDTPGDALGVAVDGSYAYVADGSSRLRVIDVSDPINPVEVGNNSGCYKNVAVSESYAYCDGLTINDVSDPSNPSEVSYFHIPGIYAFQSVTVKGSYAYVAKDGDGFWVINVHDPLNPSEAGFFDTPGYAFDVAVGGNYAYVADRGHGLTILHLTEFKDDTQTIITSDAPDPSKVGEPFSVAFDVTADNGFPSGSVTVTVTGETESCSGTLTGGTGNCMITLNNSGTFTLTATYAGDNFFLPSSDTEPHEVMVTKQIFMRDLYLPIINRNVMSCPPLYQDDFSNTGSGWPIEVGSDFQMEYLEGKYRLWLDHEDGLLAGRPGFLAADYALSVDLQNVSGVYGSYGLVFGLSDDWSQFYSFEIDPQGYYSIFLYNNGGWSTLGEGFSPAINHGSATNHLKIVRNGSLIEAWANGNLLSSISNNAYTGQRYVGLIASTYDERNLDVHFDNFLVEPLSCGAGTLTADENLSLTKNWERGKRFIRSPINLIEK